MSFTDTKYEADRGTIHPIRLATLTSGSSGTAPAGAIDSDINAKVSKTNREFGLRPRGVRLVRTAGTAPNVRRFYKFLPVLTPAAFAGANFNKGADVTLAGTTWKVVARLGEDY